ncbi:MAG: nucleoside triphosphate pyrophosphohydrolase [Nanoarchaeota archaeon]|nr:nucleoside triphosphate pyrophosphohydrolase [Nanoarchaeota archaeon]
MKYEKLVRDKIPEEITKRGAQSITHIAGDLEYWNKLKDKLQEEVNEFLNESNNEELIDILEVIEAICKFKGIKKQELKIIKENKANKKGKFDKRVILDEVKE